MMTDPRVDAVRLAVEKIHPILAGKGREVQGAVIADLLASWLAGHQAVEEGIDIEVERERVLTAFLAFVRQLIPINEKAILEKVVSELDSKPN